MIIRGKELAEKVINQINQDLTLLLKNGIESKIVIITLGPESVWKSYVDQKLKLAEKLKIKAEHINLSHTSEEILLNLLEKLNQDKKTHGIIVQRPLPININKEKIIKAINPQKDIDGFRPDSKFELPIFLAIEDILKKAKTFDKQKIDFILWLRSKNITVVGKGETGGKPIIEKLSKLGINPAVADSKTKHISELLEKADIIISATGKEGIIRKDNIKKGAILIGIGMHRGGDGKLKGDFDEKEIESIASFYTPTPGGVGPVNVACLLENLIKAAESSLAKS